MSLRGLRDWKQLELFQREAVVLQGLAHPGIPAYIDYFEEDTDTDRAFYIVQVIHTLLTPRRLSVIQLRRRAECSSD